MPAKPNSAPPFGGPPRKAVPTPPATPQELIANRKPRATWPTTAFLAGMVLSIAVPSVIKDWHPATPQQAALVSTLQQWARPVGLLVAVIALAVLFFQMTGEPRGAAAIRVISAAAKGLELGPNQVTLTRPKWRKVWLGRKRVRRLESGRINYAPGWVRTDRSVELMEILPPFTAGPLQAVWEPDLDRFLLSPLPPPAPTIESTVKTVKAMATNLAFVMGDLVVDQTRTEFDPKTGEIIKFVAEYKHTTRDLSDQWRLRIKHVIDAKAPCPTGAWNVLLDPPTNTITVTPTTPLPRMVDLPLLDLAEEDRMRIPIGQDASGDWVYWLPEVFPHMLLVGPTGSGKTIFINGLIEALAARGWLVRCGDAKEVSFRGYIPGTLRRMGRELWKGIEEVATTEIELERLLESEYEELRARYAALKVFGVREADLQPRLLAIDEAGDMVERLNIFYTSEARYIALVEEAIALAEAEGRNPADAVKNVPKPKGGKNPILALLWSILRLGRQSRQFVIAGTQRADVNFIPGEARLNLTCKVAMGKQDPHGLEMTFGTRDIYQQVHEMITDPKTGQRRPQRIRGRATVDMGEGPQSIQTFWAPEPGKVITGELSRDDTALVHAQQAWVNQWNGYWPAEQNLNIAGQVEKYTQFGDQPVALSKRKMDLVGSALDADLRKDFPLPPPPPAPKNTSGKRVRTLKKGDNVLLDIDGIATAVVVDAVEEDPMYTGGTEWGEVKELLINYRTEDGDVGVTSLAEDEFVDV